MTQFKFNDEEDASPSAHVPGARKGEGRMDKDELQRIVSALISDAENYTDGELSPARAQATDYYHGEKLGNEEVGRSQFIVTEVRDVVHGTLPDLLRVFFGPERPVEFTASKPEGVESAKEATEYVQFVFAEDNRGFIRAQEVMLDGLVRKIGIFKWGWEDGSIVAHEEEEVPQERLSALAQRDDVELTGVKECAPDKDDEKAPKYFDISYTVRKAGRARVWAVPPEEFISNRLAREIDGALFVGHRREMARGDLIALGVSAEDLDEHGGADARLHNNIEIAERESGTKSGGVQRDPDAGEANAEIVYVEGYVMLDVDGDGERELRRVCTIGPQHHVVSDKPVDEVPFAIWSPYIEPHVMIGHSMADLTMDLQRVKSSLVRGTLDSFSLSIFPRMTVLDGLASIEDVLNNEIGSPIRIKRDNAVQSITHPFTGAQSMPILDYFDAVSENRTGRNKGATGLDADALQSSTSQAVSAAVSASQAQKELLARNFAEQALKPLFRGLYRLLQRNQTQDRLVKLRGNYVPVNPAQWDASMDVTVNVGIGTSLPEQRIQTLTAIAGKQEEIIQMLGPDNPICSVAQLRETYARIVELSGFKDVSSFFKPVDANWQPPAPGAPPPSPEQTMAQASLQIEQMKTEKDLQIKEAEMKMKLRQQEFDNNLALQKLAQDFTLRRYAIDAQFKANYTQAQLESDARAEEAALSGAMDIRRQQHAEAVAGHQQALAAQAQDHGQGLAEDAQSHDQQMAEQQQQQQAAAAQAAPAGTEQ